MRPKAAPIFFCLRFVSVSSAHSLLAVLPFLCSLLPAQDSKPAPKDAEVKAAIVDATKLLAKFQENYVETKAPRKKDAEAEARISQLSIKALEQSLASSAGQIATLERQLAEAKQQVQEIAVRAIDGASGARALGHINQIAMEQAKNRPQG